MYRHHTGVDPMKVVQVWRKPKSLNRAFDVGLNVGGRIRDISVPEYVKSALRGNLD